jgi:hypothetical protein
VAEGCDTSIKVKSVGEYVLDVLCAYWIEVLIMSAFRNNDDCLSLSHFTVLKPKLSSGITR